MSPLATDTRGKYVAEVEIFEGRVDVTYGGDSHAIIFGQTVSFTPYITTGNSVVWRCGWATAPTGGTPLTGNGVTSAHVDPTVDERYLPPNCRG
jgi:hypothetical protein